METAFCWRDESVFLTGHTGFKGGWLALWLQQLGAHVHGYALSPPTEPSLFEAALIASAITSDTRGDLADLDSLRSAMQSARPTVVFHLAAQSLVRESYKNPLGTFLSNVIGTANVLEAARSVDSIRAIVIITTDKVYENREWVHPYRESDPLGGYDPYSASKAAAEIIVSSYRSSFFQMQSGHLANVATARAGNVIGGGDWAADRLVPDCLRAFERNEPIHLRYPEAVRPWQHVLEPLAGYILLAEALLTSSGRDFSKAWNFGPDAAGNADVGHVAETMAGLFGGNAQVICQTDHTHPHEAGLLALDSSAARSLLHWRPRWNLDEALAKTVSWHRAYLNGENLRDVSLGQIQAYQSTTS